MYVTHTGEIVIEIDTPCTEISAQQCGVGGEHRGNGNLLTAKDDESDPREPLVEVSYHHGRPARKSVHKLRRYTYMYMWVRPLFSAFVTVQSCTICEYQSLECSPFTDIYVTYIYMYHVHV